MILSYFSSKMGYIMIMYIDKKFIYFDEYNSKRLNF